MNKTIPCILMRSGTSRGPFFLKDWLPSDPHERDRLLLKIMGSPHELQIGGIGGGSSLTSKVAIISKSAQHDCDVDYLFAQVVVDSEIVDTQPNCGNMLAGVGPFSIEQGLVPATSGLTSVRVYNVNTKSKTEILVPTPHGHVEYAGDVLIDGVLEPAAPIYLKFEEMLGGITGKVFPTGHSKDCILGVDVTCIDAAQLMVLIDAQQLGLTGKESPSALDANPRLMQKIQDIRLEAGKKMGLGDVSQSVLPKPALIGTNALPSTFTSRYFTPHQCHKSHAATGAIGIAIASLLEGTINFQGLDHIQARHHILIHHPTGKIEVCIEYDDSQTGFQKIKSASIVRTVKKIFEGQVFVN